ncbi:predicted protein [Nematostella vectensis]|uniref:Uncharacterized protein n=1 Tax=Nematostella vectensis TaxID=45351 RepID=A7SR92_NEMVE|nr:exostosin-1 [Nematostella vectensis]EDO33761.1 predicted protein [Nematostella vectensis]|eukprot:XP_001625861.1 predicted protein [Nematostella vectensis]
MHAKKRYSLLAVVALVACGLLVAFKILTDNEFKPPNIDDNTRILSYLSVSKAGFLDLNDELELQDVFKTPKDSISSKNVPPQPNKCTMETCFDKTKCLSDFRIYVYPVHPGAKLSTTYTNIIKVIKESRYYTEFPEEACLFITAIDTLDRDKLSADYVHNIYNKIRQLPYWKNGENHIIFNLFAGTWPDYSEDVGFDFGKAILVKASLSSDLIRPGFDVSLPLFPKTHPHKDLGNLPHSCSAFPLERKYKLAFKGKRYLNGIGSESRNALYHIHNGRDIVLLTTCKHGKAWHKHKDERCDGDNALYDRYSYDELLLNATFCLVPRGRRLGSFRFLESLKVGCIPFLLSDGWELPFAEVIDWKKAVIDGSERLLMQVPGIVRSYSRSQVLAMKQQSLFLWNAYFSSVEKIVHTTIEVIRSRIDRSKTASHAFWNNYPGALVTVKHYSQDLHDFPFFHIKLGLSSTRFTAVIHATSSGIKESSLLYKLISSVAGSKFASKIIILWVSDSAIPANRKWPKLKIPLVIVRPDSKSGNSRFKQRSMIETDAILSLNEDIKLNSDEIDFAFVVWRDFPQRIVGFPSRDHYWDEGQSRWVYSSMISNKFSMVMTSGAFYHRYYNYMYTHSLPKRLHRLVDRHPTCEHIVMNFLVADAIRLPPIKILPVKQYYEGMGKKARKSKLTAQFDHKQKCMDSLHDAFGYMPLIKSRVRMDPLLYKDPVSNLRKRYRLLEA